MRIGLARLYPLALMFALAALTFYLERTVRQEERHPALKRHDPDYLLINFTTTTYDAQGRPESTMSAAKMIHYPDDDSTELVAPRLVQTRPGQPRVTVTAERGALAREGDDVFLYDNVRLVRVEGAGRGESRVATEYLHVVRDRGLVRTDRPVVLEEASRTLRGDGMEYHYDSGQLVLRGRVRGQFAPKAAK